MSAGRIRSILVERSRHESVAIRPSVVMCHPDQLPACAVLLEVDLKDFEKASYFSGGMFQFEISYNESGEPNEQQPTNIP